MTPTWANRRRILLRGGVMHAPGNPGATAMLIDGDVIAWLGDDAAADVYADAADEIWHLDGRLVTPGFVDAHVHATSTGLTLLGLDLTDATGVDDVLHRVAQAAAGSGASVILGHGWDETFWPERRPPTASELDRAAGGVPVYLSRVDVHSAAVSTGLMRRVDDLESLAGFDASGWVTKQAHHRLRIVAMDSVSTAQRERAQRATRARAAAVGIVAVHEMGGPTISSSDDFRGLLTLASEEPGPLAVGYWGQLAQEGGIEVARAIGALGVGGDLFVDGALGSHTACLRHAYDDEPEHRGVLYLDEETIADHVTAALDAGLPSGFHVIGDAATDVVLSAISRVAQSRGDGVVRLAGLRLEHVEMASDDHIATMARLGVTASMQPMFDALWGGDLGMYARRLGHDRAAGMNRCADLARAGVAMAFGSDAPVTELGPWAAVRAAVLHHDTEQRISARAAFNAHSRGGWRAIGQPQVGVIAPGAPAHLAIWNVSDVVVQVQDDRVRNWSTDPRSATPGLPPLDDDLPLPTAARTIVAGCTVYDDGSVNA